MGIIKQFFAERAFRGKLRSSPEAVNLYNDFCIWVGEQDVEETAGELVEFLANRFGTDFVETIDDLNYHLTINGSVALLATDNITPHTIRTLAVVTADESYNCIRTGCRDVLVGPAAAAHRTKLLTDASPLAPFQTE